MQVGDRPLDRELRTASAVWDVALVLFFVFVVAVIVAAGSGADLSWVRHVPGRDFTGHVAIYGVLAFLWHGVASRGRELEAGAPWDPRVWPKACWVLAALILAEEISQIWWPHRTFSLSDLGGDALGLWLGFSLSGILLTR